MTDARGRLPVAVSSIPAPQARSGARRRTAIEFQGVADVPPEAEWFANIGNLQTRRAYKNDIGEFMAFVGIAKPAEFRVVTRAIAALARNAEFRAKIRSATTVDPIGSTPEELSSSIQADKALYSRVASGRKLPTGWRARGCVPHTFVAGAA